MMSELPTTVDNAEETTSGVPCLREEEEESEICYLARELNSQPPDYE